MSENGRSPAGAFQELLDIIARLRAPEGCLWDRRQKKTDVGTYLIEEAFEVLDAIETETAEGLKEELGDLLFQILFIARISEEEGAFDIREVIKGVTEKMIRRHPHVFGDEKAANVEEIRANWEIIKRNVERKGQREDTLFRGIPLSMPALLRAEKVSKEASKAGFDWESAEGVLRKIDEEMDELKQALASMNKDRIRDEMGDILFTFVNLGRFTGVNAEEALRSSTRKFIRRFRFIEKRLKESGKTLSEVSFDEMDALWNEAKKTEQGPS